jgi:SAM-dependent methyltransferase
MEPTRIFSGRADDYRRARPGYAPALTDFLSRRLPSGGQCAVADIGSGTGIFTRALLELGCAVWAVEPNADMRAKAEEALRGFPGFRSVAAPAEATALPDACMDAVTAASSFHWLDARGFAREALRILRPAGRCISSSTQGAWTARSRRRSAAYARLSAPLSRALITAIKSSRRTSAIFSSPGFARRNFSFDLDYDREGFVRRTLSSSYAPAQNDPARAGFIKALEICLTVSRKAGRLIVPNDTVLFFGKPARTRRRMKAARRAILRTTQPRAMAQKNC